MFRFDTPHMLLLLTAIPLVIVYRRHRCPSPRLKTPGTQGLEGLPTSPMAALARLLPVIKYGALCLMIIALARPQWGVREVSIRTEGINIVLAVDLSESMAALDFERDGKIVNRLEAVIGVIRSFVSKRSGDRIGLVVFGDHAYTQLPLTRDYGTLIDMLHRLTIGAAGKSTAIGDAIGISLKRLADIEGKSNIIILLTDGRSNSGALSPEAAARIAAQKAVKIYAIGVGGTGEAPFRVTVPGFGERYVYQRVDMDEDTLRMISTRTDGMWFRAEDTQTLEKIYETIDRLEKTEAMVKTFDQYRDLYSYPLLPALGLLALWMILVNTRFLRIP